MVRSSLKYPYAVLAACLVVIILGVLAYEKMLTDIFPDIKTPVVAIVTFYKGMGPNEIEGAITLRLEQVYVQASYIDHIESRSLPGVSIIKVFFDPSYDINAGLAEIVSLTYSSLRYLPKGIWPPIVMKYGASSLPIADITFSGQGMSEKETRDLAYYNARPQLAEVTGSSIPPTFGGTIRQITVFLDRERLLARNVGLHEVVEALNSQNLLLPAADVKIGDLDYNVYSDSMIEDVGKMNEMPIKIAEGVPIQLRDIGKAVDSFMIQTNLVRIDGRRAVYIPLLKQVGANTITVIEDIKERIQNLRHLPEALNVKLIYDQSLYIRQAISTLEHEGLLGGTLACLMVLLFLGSWRSTSVVVLAIPLSVTAALCALYFTGNSINMMTLGGLALAVGRLVDDAIVVVENFHRHLGMNKSAHAAAADAVTEVATPMLVITITVFLVFLPIAFFTGVVKFLFVPLGLTVAYAMMASYFMALSVAPVTLEWLYRDKQSPKEQTETVEKGNERPASSPQAQESGHEDHQQTPERRAHWYSRVSAWWKSITLFEPFVEWYIRTLKWCLAHKAVVISLVGVLFVGTVFLSLLLSTEFFPQADVGAFIMHVSAPQGTRIEKTEALLVKLEDLIKQHIPEHELDQIVSNIGVPFGYMILYTTVAGPHQGFTLVNLKRDRKTATSDVIARLRQEIPRQFPGIKVRFEAGGIVSKLISFGIPADIDVKLQGDNLAELQQVAGQMYDQVVAVQHTVDVQVYQGMDYPELHVKFDRAKADYLGLNEKRMVTDLITGLASNIQLEPTWWIDPKSHNAYFVVAQFPEQNLEKFEDFLNLPLSAPDATLPSATTMGTVLRRGSELALGQTPFPELPRLPVVDGNIGAVLLLRDFASVDRRDGPETVDHYGLEKSVDILANVEGNDLGGVARKIEQAVENVQLPKSVKLTMKGDVEHMRSAMKGFATMLPVAILLMYVIMVGLFRSFLDPIVILFAVPLGFIGVVWMLLATQTSVNVESLIGTLMMTGIVVSNSILLVDFANSRLQEGKSIEEAVVDAGRLRIRPILMTSIATIIGLTPMALGVGEGSAMNMPLARAVIGGLSFATIVTLLFIPVLHAAFRGRRGAKQSNNLD